MKRLPDPHERPWLTVAELADLTGEGEKVIRAALDRGQLPRIDVGRYVRIPTASLLQQCGIDNAEAASDPEDTEIPGHTEADAATAPATATIRLLRTGNDTHHGVEEAPSSSITTATTGPDHRGGTR